MSRLIRAACAVLVAVIVSCLAAPRTGLAQDAPADTAVVPIPGVVVTGTRVPESALKIPAAVTLVPRGDFAGARNINLKDALGFVPGVFTQSRSGAQDVRITIRGFGARGSGDRSNTGGTRGIRILSDGLPLTEPDGRTSLDFADLGNADRVEVSRSNASALYGNASGGVIHLRSSYDFDKAYFDVSGRGGSFGYHREQGQVGFTIGKGRGTVLLQNSTFDGWREHSMSTQVLGQARFHVPLDDQTRLGIVLDGTSNLNRFPGALTEAEMDSLPEMANPTFVARDERRRNRIARLGVTLDRQIEDRQALSFAAFVEPKALQRSERNTFRDFSRYHIGGSATYQLQGNLGSGGMHGVATVGVDDQYQDGSQLFYNLTPDGGRGTTLTSNAREGANSGGGFVQGELRWGEHWSVRAAARYDNLHYISENHTNPTLDATRNFTQWTPKGSIAWLMGNHTLYAAIGGGVEAPAFNEINPPPPFDTTTSFNPFLEPMQSTSYEIGFKGGMGLGANLGSLGYDVAIYQIDVTNDIIPFNGGAYFFTAGETRRRGVELGADWRPTSPLRVRTTMAFTNNEYITYSNNLGIFDGNEQAGLPATTVTGAVSYTLPVGLSVEGRVEHVGSYFADDANTAEAESYVIFGGSVGFERNTSIGTLRAFVSGENLSDELYTASVFINGTGGRFYEPGLPQNWSFGASIRF